MISAWRSIMVTASMAVVLFLGLSAVAAPGEKAAGDRPGRGAGLRPGRGGPEARPLLPEGPRGNWQGELLQAHPELDTNGDGRLSPEEMKAGRATVEAFRQSRMSKQILAQHPEADADGDGQLSEEEMRAFRQSRLGMAEGRPGPGQMIDWLIGHFDRADTDGNGQLSKEELLKLKEQIGEGGLGPARLGPAGGKAEAKAKDTGKTRVLAGPDHPKGEKKVTREGRQQRKAAKEGTDQPAPE